MPLVRMQLLFWTPFAEHNDINQQVCVRVGRTSTVNIGYSDSVGDC